MILRLFGFPREGGGWARRYLQFTRDRIKIYNESSDSELFYKPITLFDLSRHDDAVDARRFIEEEYGELIQDSNNASNPNSTNNVKRKKNRTEDGWKISDDRVIGGYSESFVRFVEKGNDTLVGHSLSPKTSDELIVDGEKEGTLLTSIPYLHWYGTVDTQVGYLPTSDVHRSGFAALRSPLYSSFYAPDGADLGGMYNAIEILCRCQNNREFTLNVKVSSAVPEDMYQGTFNPMKAVIKPYRKPRLPTALRAEADSNDITDTRIAKVDYTGCFKPCLIPFSTFNLTSMGRPKYANLKMDGRVRIESIGITLMDGISGPFEFDLARIRAVNVDENGSVYEYVKNKDDDHPWAIKARGYKKE